MAAVPISLVNHFLIAMPAMADPNFSRTVTYICEHSESGALGVVVNRPTDMTLGMLLSQLDIEVPPGAIADSPVSYGGPVQTERGFVLHQPVGQWRSSLPVRGDLALTTSKDILEAVGRGEGPDRLMVTLGYSGWGPGQLESELAQNSWLTVEASDAVLFDTPPEGRLQAAMGLLGVSFATLSDEAGHA